MADQNQTAAWTEGVCGDAVAILRDGCPVSISEILRILNEYEKYAGALSADPVLVGYDYEESYPDPHPDNYWHIYGGDLEGDVVITGPKTPEMHEAIIRAANALNSAYALALKLSGQEETK